MSELSGRMRRRQPHGKEIDSADGHSVCRSPYDSGVLSPFAAFRDLKTEDSRLRRTSLPDLISSGDQSGVTIADGPIHAT